MSPHDRPKGEFNLGGAAHSAKAVPVTATRSGVSVGRRNSLQRLLAGAGTLALPGLASAQATASTAPSALARARERGMLRVAVYNDMPPFNLGGRGIDIELAQALADALELKLSLMPFNADENMGDDLRNMVWRGHYLGFGPADVLLHVPVDRPLMDATPQATIFAPYYRDRVAIARDLSKLPVLDSLAPLAGLPVAVPGQSLAGWLMIGADNGAYREQLRTQWANGAEAAAALVRGEVPAAAGLMSELEAVLRGDARYAISPMPTPRAPRDGWAVGLAVKRDATDLAQALQAAVNGLVQNGRLKTVFANANVTWRAA